VRALDTTIFETYNILFYIFTALFGLAVGSFLNVVISRYPQILKQQWQNECRDYLGLEIDKEQTKLSLAFPGSHCPHCKTPIKFYHNIPLFSFIWLRGKCAYCKHPISFIYPIIELLSGVLSILVYWYFGPTWQMLAALFFTYVLITASLIDFNHQILPDLIILPTLWIGLMLNTINFFTPLPNAVWAASIGYLLPWLIAWLFLKIRGKQGMGHGDFKMLAMVGAWFGFYMMVNTLLFAVILGAIISLLLLLFKRVAWQRPVPFGPYLAIAAWISMLTGPFFVHWLQV
jgi:leader peptidase (prepilin peptidase) / N-methyltransferase